MPVIEHIKSAIKRTSLYSQYCPTFGRPEHGASPHEAWLLDKVENIVNSNLEDDSVSALTAELFFGSSFLVEILHLSKSRSELQNDEWESKVFEFEDEIKNTSCDALRSLQWKDLNTIAWRFGLFRAGYAFRAKAIEYLYSKGVKNKNMAEICELFTAAMELGDYETAKQILDKKLNGWKGLFRCVKNARLFYSNMCNYERIAQSRGEYLSEEDKSFAKYVKGKRIALVGPAQPKNDNGPEIDKYDIIARFTYQGKSHISPKLAGSRTDISYYCSWKGRELAKLEDKNFLLELDYIVHKDPRNRLNMQNVNERSVCGFTFLAFNGNINMIPIAVADLLSFDAKEIRIFNANFFLAGESYAKGYAAVIDEPVIHSKNTLLRMIAEHDQLTQISIIRNLWKKDLCNVDDELDNIFSMSNEEIMDLYGRLHQYTWVNH